MSNPNRGARPPGGHEPVRTVRFSDDFVDKIDHWATQQEDQPGRSEAIRRLVEIGLTIGTAKLQQTTAARADRANELASETIREMGDPTAHPDERARRHRRLTKGPEEFRDVRVDREKIR